MSEPADEELARLRRRFDRERAARVEAETIAERVTADLYATARALETTNLALTRTNDELQEVNQQMRDFVAIASHDLRGPLTAILGFAETLMRRGDRLTETQRADCLTTIKRQGEHLARLVEDLLTISRIEAGALDIHRDVVLLRDAVVEAIDDFSQHAAEIHVRAPQDLSVMVDRDHLRRILENFVGNALKYGSPPVDVEALDAGEWIEIRVRDAGAGVPEAFRARLFSRFARSEEAVAGGQGGTGLGLSIVQGLAHANGGDAWYEPNVPTGSVFAVRLPRAAA